MSDLIEISGIEIDASILRGRNLVAKDRNAFRKKTSSDVSTLSECIHKNVFMIRLLLNSTQFNSTQLTPSLFRVYKKPYAQLYINGKSHGQTRVIYKTLDPAWNESFKVMLNASDSNRVFLDFKNGKELEYEIRLFDKDEYSNDDSMGMVKGSISLAKPPTRKWMEVVTAPGHSKAVSGEIEVDISVSVRKMITAIRGNSLDLNGGLIDVMLDWKLESGSVDLDTSCVAVDPNGKILMDETVYFGDLVNSNGSIRHSGDVRSGGSKGEKITCHLSTIKPHVKALYFILTVATPEKSFLDVTSALVSVLDKTNQNVLCKFNPSLVGDHTAMFLMRISRKNNGYGWEMTMIEDTDHTGKCSCFVNK
jgi:stress response protein SCP2